MKVLPPILSVVAAAALTLGLAAAQAHGYKIKDIAIGHVWTPPAEAGSAAAVYGPFLNEGDKMAKLVGVSTPIADQARFHADEDGQESWPDNISLPPGKPVSLAAWREHIWLSGLHQALKAGDSFDMTLDFGPEGKLPIKVVVESTAGH